MRMQVEWPRGTYVPTIDEFFHTPVSSIKRRPLPPHLEAPLQAFGLGVCFAASQCKACSAVVALNWTSKRGGQERVEAKRQLGRLHPG